MANYSFEKNINRDERDLVVWSSRLSTDISPSIVFGCFTSNGNELSQIKNNDLKFFLELILHDEKIAQKAVLLPLPPGEDPDDPEMNNATYVSLITKTKLTRRHLAVVWNEEPAEPGNYFLFMNASGRLQGVAPAVKKGAITSRSGPRRYLPSMVQSGWEFRTKKKQKTDPQEKKTRIKRNPRVRKEVRARDIRCRVCGLEVHRRQRGGNFKGVQVAHVFALAAMSVESASASLFCAEFNIFANTGYRRLRQRNC
ncbi:hypothetical protein C8R45DRAFT_330007 [Mycena sanguinolenta]|nr:hypothetical protein C8R45DRAFT_330007 [Mycena sanguinolenta]